MSDTITSVLAILLIFVGLPLLILKVRDRANRAHAFGCGYAAL